MKAYWQLLRIPHFVKNLLTLAPLVFSGGLFRGRLLSRGTAAFCVMCLISSGVYVLNDLRDAREDGLHPVKCRRPIPSGAISRKQARVLSGFLLCTGMVWNFLAFSFPAVLLPVLYLLLNLGYSFGMKQIPLLDIALLASGFLIRLLYGSAVTGIPISQWLFLTVLALSFYFSLGKRRQECRYPQARKVLEAYPPSFLSSAMNLCLTLALVFYSLWSMDSTMIYSVPLVLLIVLRYSLALERGGSGDPVEILLGDNVLLGLCLGYGVLLFVLLYL